MRSFTQRELKDPKYWIHICIILAALYFTAQAALHFNASPLIMVGATGVALIVSDLSAHKLLRLQ